MNKPEVSKTRYVLWLENLEEREDKIELNFL